MKQIYLLIFFCIIAIGSLFILYSSSSKNEQALQAFQSKDINHSTALLHEIKDTIPPPEYQLYLSYLARESGDLSRSNERLKFAWKHEESLSYSLEIALNHILNAYLQEDGSAFRKWIQRAKEIDSEQPSKNPWVTFFQGLQAYLKKEYSQAKKLWAKSTHRPSLSPWMDHAFNKQFDDKWIEVHQTIIQIESGEILAARQRLTKLLSQSENKNHILLLIGFTYLEEAKHKRGEESLTYYQLASSYFFKIPSEHPLLLSEQKRHATTQHHCKHNNHTQR